MINQIKKNYITSITNSQSFTYSKSSSNNIELRDKSKSFNCYQGINYRRIKIIDNPFLKKAAELGGTKAIVKWALSYKNGSGGVQNKEKAFKLFLWAALNGNAEAMHNLGICYSCGIGTVKNQNEAFKWFMQAVAHDYKLSIFNLAEYYYFVHNTYLSAFLFGLIGGQVGVNIMHDGNHMAFSNNKWMNTLAGFTLELLGTSAVIYKRSHDFGHHGCVNHFCGSVVCQNPAFLLYFVSALSLATKEL